MWKLAKTSTQKLAIIKKQVPISARDWNQAIIAFVGDDDFSVAQTAELSLAEVPQQQLMQLLSEELTHTSAKVILDYANGISSSVTVIKLIELRKITDIDFIDIISKQSEQFWNPLVTHGDFVALMAHMKPDLLEKIEFSPSLQYRFNEQFSYLTDEKIEAYHRDISTLKFEKVEPEVVSFDNDDDMVIIMEDEDVVEFTDEFSDMILDENSEEEGVISLDDADFFMEDNAFSNLTREEQAEKREKIQVTIKKMSIGEKTKLAMIGNLEIRKILIKDPIKLIAKAVLSNNGITAKEIALTAGNAATSIDLISYIANTKSLNKYYQVKMALVANPKLPIKLGMRLLEVIRMADLKKIAKSRGISATLRQRALRRIK